jgi:hypothetical protein
VFERHSIEDAAVGCGLMAPTPTASALFDDMGKGR